MEANYEDLFLCEEIHAADGLLDGEAFLHFAGLNIPEADGLVVRAADQSLPYSENSARRAGGGMQANVPRKSSVVQ